MVTFSSAIALEELAMKIKSKLALPYLQIARSRSGSSEVTTVAICAGSGASVIAGTHADVYFTGEMSHHDVLAANAANTHVILCGHTNTERPFLPTLQRRLQDELWDAELEVTISKADAHPLQVL